MRYKTYSMVSLLKDDDHSYQVNITNSDGQQVPLFTNAQFRNMIKFRFPSYELICPKYYDDESGKYEDIVESKVDAISMLHELFDMWVADRKPAFEKLYQALRAKYNPIWNVDGVTGTVSENSKTGFDDTAHAGRDVVTNSGSDTNTKSGNETVTDAGEDKVKNEYDSFTNRTGKEIESTEGTEADTTQVTTFDANTWMDKEKVTKDYGDALQGTQKVFTRQYDDVKDNHDGEDTETTTYGKTETHTYNDVKDKLEHGKIETSDYGSSSKTTYNNKDNYVEMIIRQGNIGITSTQSLITEQVNLTSLDQIVYMAINDFIHTVCIVGGGVR